MKWDLFTSASSVRLQCAIWYLVLLEVLHIPLFSIVIPSPRSPAYHNFWHQPTFAFLSLVQLIWLVQVGWMTLLMVDLYLMSCERPARFRVTRTMLYVGLIGLMLAKTFVIQRMASL